MGLSDYIHNVMTSDNVQTPDSNIKTACWITSPLASSFIFSELLEYFQYSYSRFQTVYTIQYNACRYQHSYQILIHDTYHVQTSGHNIDLNIHPIVLNHYRCWNRYPVSQIFGDRHPRIVSQYPAYMYLNTNILFGTEYKYAHYITLYPRYLETNTIVLSPNILHTYIWTQISCLIQNINIHTILPCIPDIWRQTPSYCLPISCIHIFEHKHPVFIPRHILVTM